MLPASLEKLMPAAILLPVCGALCIGWVCESSPTGSAPRWCAVGPETAHQTPEAKPKQQHTHTRIHTQADNQHSVVVHV